MAQRFENLTLQEAISLCDSTTSFASKDVKTILSTMQALKFMKPTVTNGVQVGDVLKWTGLGHPGIIFRIDADEVYFVVITTEKECKALLRQCKSRLYSKSFFTTTISVMGTAQAEENVAAIYDNVPELKDVVRDIKEFYRVILKKKTKPKQLRQEEVKDNEQPNEEV